MAKSAIYDYSATAASNTDIDGLDSTGATGLVKSGDNYSRSMMAHLRAYANDLGGVNTVGGTANAITLTLAAPLLAYVTGQMFSFIVAATNTSQTVGITVNGISSKSIKVKNALGSSVDPAIGALPVGWRAECVYDGTNVILMNPASTATAQSRRNRLVNPALQISQENGNTSATTNGYYVADQCAVYRVTSAGTITVQRVQSQTLYKSKDRARITITAADASLAAGEYLTFNQNIEGQNVADFAYGAAGARQSVLRFGFKGPAGTYAVSLKNSALNRSYVKTFNPASANTDEMISLVIPGDTSGTWLTDTGIGISLDIVLASGSTFQGTDAAWQAGNILGTSGVSNGMGTISQVFEIFDIGLYLDPDNTGVAPAWELPEYADDLQLCKRYYRRYGPSASAMQLAGGYAFSTTQGIFVLPLEVQLRTDNATLAVSAVSDWYTMTGTNGTAVCTVIVATSPFKDTMGITTTVASGLTAGDGSRMQAVNANAWLSLNSRM